MCLLICWFFIGAGIDCLIEKKVGAGLHNQSCFLQFFLLLEKAWKPTGKIFGFLSNAIESIDCTSASLVEI
jgi:hypothetical protein